MTPDRDLDDRQLDQPELVQIADAILDGRPIDWPGVGSSKASQYADALRLIDDVGALHRSTAELVNSTFGTGIATPSGFATWNGLTLLERIAEGAFGEVFRAWDPRLDREVALKLLRRASGDALRQTSSIEEGRLLARIRQPHVVTVFGAEAADGRIGLWTEFIHGRTLSMLMRNNGRFSAQEAALIGIDLCAALSAVHAAGLVHRDVKPQNVMREDGGRIVLVDFGGGRDQVAHAMQRPADGRTLTGTPLYLAPEVWRGSDATPISDLYSLGVLLFHLVTGTHPIPGKTVEEVRGAHARGEHRRLRDLRADLPSAFVDVIERALAIEPVARFESAGAFEAALRGLQSGTSMGVSEPRQRARWTWPVAAACATAALLLLFWQPWRSAAPTPVQRFVLPVAGAFTPTGVGAPFAISSDGLQVAYVAHTSSRDELYVRPLNEFAPRLLYAAQRLNSPFFSPNGQSIGVIEGPEGSGMPRLLRVSTAGGPAHILVANASPGPGAAWASDRSIIFPVHPDLWQVAETGGPPKKLTSFNSAMLTRATRPQALPDGRILFTLNGDSGRPHHAIVLNHDGSFAEILDNVNGARYAKGFLFFIRQQWLMAAPFDLRTTRTTSPAFEALPVTLSAYFDVSTTGTLVYSARTGDPESRRSLMWLDVGSGALTPVPIELAASAVVLLSPDGRHIALATYDDATLRRGYQGLWIGDLERGNLTRLLADDSPARLYAWTADGRYVTYTAPWSGATLRRIAVDGSAADELIASSGPFGKNGEWSPDGLHLLLRPPDGQVDTSDILTWRSAGAIGHAEPSRQRWIKLRKSPADIGDATGLSFSPDGRWVAYHSLESGTPQVYVTALSGRGPTVQVSVTEGRQPFWRGDTLFYRQMVPDSRIMAARIDTRNGLRAEVPHSLAPLDANAFLVGVAPDGHRLLVIDKSQATSAQLNVVVNWTEELKARTATR
jgi:hypothetical protein